MPASDTVRHFAGRKAALSRSRCADDPELVSVSQSLKEQQLADYINETLAKAPPLTSEQRAKLAELLRPVRREASE
ncbi:phiRv1 phage protein [Mycobacterium bohemicum DSM 44277]|uniref:PhiRv1 phage protein n=2 Tax=Mycobacterium bohemicum TaxID=56425 RepID=A0A1X1QWL8_MYCBE|nr:hypothetical protein [Mycobacterium bohemicum]MCV6970093.1 hypothetical protein [Mycobacterium bohemicum]ORU95782.1 hypothetical protein AWB93_22660 [Mycobacterium bohemicum]CPR10500.1 phiRv1 phage protein [Mycobacterium bohemicum DSM 44277]